MALLEPEMTVYVCRVSLIVKATCVFAGSKSTESCSAWQFRAAIPSIPKPPNTAQRVMTVADLLSCKKRPPEIEQVP